MYWDVAEGNRDENQLIQEIAQRPISVLHGTPDRSAYQTRVAHKKIFVSAQRDIHGITGRLQ